MLKDRRAANEACGVSVDLVCVAPSQHRIIVHLSWSYRFHLDDVLPGQMQQYLFRGLDGEFGETG